MFYFVFRSTNEKEFIVYDIGYNSSICFHIIYVVYLFYLHFIYYYVIY